TADTLVGPQHPAYDYRLSGKGDLVLTEVNARTAVIELPPEPSRVLVIQAERGQVLAEVGPGTARRVAVAPGVYPLRAWRRGKRFGWQAWSRVKLLAGLEAGGGVVVQAPDQGAALWSAVATAAATAGAQVRLTDALSLSVDASAGWTLLRRETQERAVMFLPT